MNERSTSSFGSAIAVSSTSELLAVSTDILRVSLRVERGWMEYGLWIGFGIKPPLYPARQGGGNCDGHTQALTGLAFLC